MEILEQKSNARKQHHCFDEDNKLIKKGICPECESSLEFLERLKDEHQDFFDEKDVNGNVPYYREFICSTCCVLYHLSDAGEVLHW